MHVVAADGVFEESRDRWGQRTARFIRVPPPSEEELKQISERVRRKVLRRFVRLGAIPKEVAEQMLSWENSGFCMHAGTSVQAHDREGLGRLLRYCARPALSPKRLRYLPKENLVLYEAERQGKKKRVLRLEPVEFLRRVALLKPPPRKNLVRYHGALAPNAPMRPLIADIAQRYARKKLARGRQAFEKLGAKITQNASRAWAALISRIYEVDPLQCPRCGGRMELMAVIVEVDEVTRLLNYFELPTGFPKTLPARSPPEAEAAASPDEESQLDPRVDLYEGIDPLPAD